MSRIFPPRSREYFLVASFVVAGIVVIGIAATSYYATPAYTRVGYEPRQPISFSHKLHAGDLNIDCRHCHNHVGDSPHANIPSVQTCLNCHGTKWGNVAAQSHALKPLRDAEETGRPLEWARVHKVPEYAYFNHAVHVKRGVSCVSCHGRIDQMEVVRQAEPLSMSWCLECHMAPEQHLRPRSELTNMEYGLDTNSNPNAAQEAAELGAQLVAEKNINPPIHCSACHR